MQFFGQRVPNPEGYRRLEQRYGDGRESLATMMVDAYRAFLALALPRDVTFFGAAKAKVQRFLRELDSLPASSNRTEFVATKGVA